MRWPSDWSWSSTRARTLALIAAGSLLSGLVIRGVQGSLSSVFIDRARLVIPTTPLVPPAEAVLAKEYGQLGHLYVREGEAVITGQPLFSLERDPQVDQDLAERGLARDLTDLNEQIRDTRRSIEGLNERIVLNWEFENPYLDQQIEVARRRLTRREDLWREGGINRDLVDDGQERLLRLKEAQLIRRQNETRLKDLEQMRQHQQGQLLALENRQRWLHRQDLVQRAEGRIHPPGSINQDGSSDYAIYRASGRGLVLRLLKRPGESIRPRESVALLQRDQPPPDVEALLPMSDRWMLEPAQLASVEVPSLRQRFNARLQALSPGHDGLLQLRFVLIGLQPQDIRRLRALPGESVRVAIPRRYALVQWLGTRPLQGVPGS